MLEPYSEKTILRFKICQQEVRGQITRPGWGFEFERSLRGGGCICRSQGTGVWTIRMWVVVPKHWHPNESIGVHNTKTYVDLDLLLRDSRSQSVKWVISSAWFFLSERLYILTLFLPEVLNRGPCCFPYLVASVRLHRQCLLCSSQPYWKHQEKIDQVARTRGKKTTWC